MKKALLKKIPVIEASMKDKQYLELCRQNYLMKVQKATVDHKRTLILNLYAAEEIAKEQYLPLCRIFFSNGEFITYFPDEKRWTVRVLGELENEYGEVISGIALRTCKEEKSVKQFFRCLENGIDMIEIIKKETVSNKRRKGNKTKKEDDKQHKKVVS